MSLISRTVLALAVLAAPLAAQPRMHPDMGMVPTRPSVEALPPYAPTVQGAGDLTYGYGAYNLFTLGRTDFGYLDTDDTPPFEVMNIRVGLGLSYYAGSFVPDRAGPPGFNGGIYALTGGPNLGGTVPGLYEIDPSDGLETRLSDADPGYPTFGWTGMAFDPVASVLFAVATDCAGSSDLYKSEPPFEALTHVGALSGDLICPINLMIDGHGHKYTLDVGLTQTNDFLYRIGDALLAERLSENAGFDAGFAQGGAFSALTERMYLASIRVQREPTPAQGAPEGELRLLDIGPDGEPTGSTTLVGPFAEDGDIEANFFTFPYPANVATGPATPRSFDLSDAYPNPFNPSATLTLRLLQTEHVRATLHDTLGREVGVLQDGVLAAGPAHFLPISAADLPSGIYVIRVVVGNFATTRAVTLVR